MITKRPKTVIDFMTFTAYSNDGVGKTPKTKTT